MAKNVLKTSKVIENYLQYFEHRRDFDAFIINPGSTSDPFQGHQNPWISDTVDFWQHDKMYFYYLIFITFFKFILLFLTKLFFFVCYFFLLKNLV